MSKVKLTAVAPINVTTPLTTDLSILFPGSDEWSHSVQDDMNALNCRRVRTLKKKIYAADKSPGINVPSDRPSDLPNGGTITNLDEAGTQFVWCHVEQLRKDKRQRKTVFSAIFQNLNWLEGFDYDCAGTIDVVIYPIEIDPDRVKRVWDGWHRVFKAKLGIEERSDQWVYCKITVLDIKDYPTREACDKRARELFDARNHHNRKVTEDQMFVVNVHGKEEVATAEFASLLKSGLVLKPMVELIESKRADAILNGLRQWQIAQKNYGDNDGEFLRDVFPFSKYADGMNLVEMAFKFVTGLYKKEKDISGYLGFGMSRFLEAFGEQIDLSLFVDFMEIHAAMLDQTSWTSSVVKGSEPAHIAVKIANEFNDWMIRNGHFVPKGKQRYIPTADITREFDNDLLHTYLTTKSNSFQDKLYEQAGSWVDRYKIGTRVSYDEFCNVAEEAFEDTFYTDE